MNFKKGLSSFITSSRAKKSYLPPGNISFHVNSNVENNTIVSVFSYNEAELTEKQELSVEQINNTIKSDRINWINVDGLGNKEKVKRISKLFDLHPLTIEDILNTDQRAKFEDYEDYIALVMRMIYYEEEELKTEQLCLILKTNTVISFQEQHGDPFEAIRERIRTCKGRVRRMGADYLTYALIDAVVDSYFILLDKLGDKLDLLEHEVSHNPGKESIQKLQNFKRQLLLMRKLLLPTRELVLTMQKDENRFFGESTGIYLRDLMDHIVRVTETIETFKDIVVEMMENYRSYQSQRLNETMKMLTIISTIFIPLTFIVGVYGMNFEYMPELQQKWGYPAVMVVMAITGVSLVIYFKKKKWM